MTHTDDTAARDLCSATGRDSIGEAIAWIAEGHPLDENVNLRDILRALVQEGRDGSSRTAQERIVRELATSHLDTAAILFSLDEIRPPERFRAALDALAWKSPTNTLMGLTSASVLAAQRAESSVIPALCAIAGISTSKLHDWSEVDLPAGDEDNWGLQQAKSALDVIDRLVRGEDEASLASAEPLRALELLTEAVGVTGWEAVEQMRRGGVPYEVLLAQREVGGGWLAHRNRTSNKVSGILTEELCHRLDARDVDFLRSARMGGSVSSTEVERVSGGSRSVGLVVRDRRQEPVAAVAFSVARDGGTARSSGSRLLKLRDARLPILLLLAGPGWAERNETADLAEAFDGEIYTDEHLDELADELARRAARSSS